MPNPVTCALKLSRLAWPYLPSFRLADVADNGAQYAEPPHRALGDCERALLVYLAAIRELQKAD
jgi:DNA polymerase-3 subunit epsilon/DNA polymerase-3 subunit alpha (Gram-positive type)